MERGNQMAVGVQGKGDGTMPEHLTHDLGMRSLCEEERGGGVPEIVKADMGQAGTFERIGESSGFRAGIKRPAERAAEYQVIVLPQGAGCESLFKLARPVLT